MGGLACSPREEMRVLSRTVRLECLKKLPQLWPTETFAGERRVPSMVAEVHRVNSIHLDSQHLERQGEGQASSVRQHELQGRCGFHKVIEGASQCSQVTELTQERCAMARCSQQKCEGIATSLEEAR